MSLTNYRDCSINGADFNAGFQFEFACCCCTRRWKSPFKPYRTGQFSALLNRFMFLLPKETMNAGRASTNFTDMGSRGAKESALREAVSYAERVFADCTECGQTVCEDCRDASGVCPNCRKNDKAKKRQDDAAESADRAAHQCPNCSTPMAGGRFCPECGFDMASTHKSCPSCGALASRSSRFCTDCGHSF